MKSRVTHERLIKLAEHLENGKLSVDVFDYANDGTLRECAYLFPDDWKLDSKGQPHCPNMWGSSIRAASKFFGVSQHIAFILFAPCALNAAMKALPRDASRAQVAAHIRDIRNYLARVE